MGLGQAGDEAQGAVQPLLVPQVHALGLAPQGLRLVRLRPARVLALLGLPALHIRQQHLGLGVQRRGAGLECDDIRTERLGLGHELSGLLQCCLPPLAPLQEGLHRRAQLGCRREALRSLGRHGPQAELRQLFGDLPLRRTLPRVRRRPARYREHQRVEVRSLVGWLQGQQLVQHRPQAPDVAAPVQQVQVPPRLLGAHEARSADGRAVHRPRHRQLLDGLAGDDLGHIAHRPRHAPVQQQHLSEGPQHDVVRLDVPVQHPAVVGVGKRIAHLDEGNQQLRARELDDGGLVTGLQRGEHLPQRAALHLLHHEVELALFRHPHVVDRHDVGVLELPGDLSLRHEARQLDFGHLARIHHHLDGHRAADLRVACLEHLAHAAAAQLAQELEAAQAHRIAAARSGLHRLVGGVAQAQGRRQADAQCLQQRDGRGGLAGGAARAGLGQEDVPLLLELLAGQRPCFQETEEPLQLLGDVRHSPSTAKASAGAAGVSSGGGRRAATPAK